MTTILLLISLAIAPCIAIAIFIYIKDRFEKEPLFLLFLSYFFGLFTIIPPAIIELLYSHFIYKEAYGNILSTAIYAFMIVGLSEEGSKFFLLRMYPYRNKEFNNPFDGIIYSVMISMGFATAENILYVVQGGLSTGLVRMFTAVPAHACFGVFMGFYVGLAKFKKNSSFLMFLGLLSAVAAHGLYDFFLLQRDLPLLQILAFVCLIVSVILSFRAIKIRSSIRFKEQYMNQTYKENQTL